MNIDTLKKLINLVLQNNINMDNNILQLILQNPLNQIAQFDFLKKKRILYHQDINYNNKNTIEECDKFCPDKNNIEINEYPDYYRQTFGYNNNSIYENIKELNNYSFNYLHSNNNKENMIPNYFINDNINNINNIKSNFNENHLNSFSIENIENIKENISNKINQNFNSIYYSNSIYRKRGKERKKIIKPMINQIENNNEIKVLKNNKIVYINKSLLNSYSSSKNIKELNKISFVRRNKRSSQYRGVSKNGNQWQVLIMVNRNKSYIGSYPNEEIAARIYDIFALKNRGIKARTNFIYSSIQIKKICEIDIDIKSKNIYEIISQLNEE